jgi:hypothetical protein
MTTPQPRPALRRADDGTVHPAAAHLSSLAVDVSTAPKQRRKGKKNKDAEKAEETVELIIMLPKRTRRQLRQKAETYGWTAEEAAAHVLRVWADR